MKSFTIKSFLLLSFSFLLMSEGYATKQDSLFNLIQNTEDDHRKVKLINDLSLHYIKNEKYTEAIKVASKGLNIALWNNYQEGIIDAYNCIAYSYFFHNNYAKSLENYLYEAKYLEKTSNYAKLSKTYNNIALLYNNFEKPKKSIQYSQKSLLNLKKIKDRDLMIDCYTNLADSYRLLKEYNNEIKYLRKCIGIRESNKEIDKRGIEYNNLGSAYWNLQKYDLALFNFNLYLKISVDTNDSLGVARSNHNIGSTYYSLGQYSKSLEYFQRSIELKQANIAISYTELVYAYCKLGDLKKAAHYFKLAETAKAEIKELAKASDSIVALCLKANNVNEAFKYQLITSNLKEKLLNAFKSDIASTVKVQYEVDGIETRIAEKENYALTKENLALQSKQKHFLMIILILTVIIAVGVVYLVRRRLLEKQKKLAFFEEGIEEIGKCLQDIKDIKAEKKAFL